MVDGPDFENWSLIEFTDGSREWHRRQPEVWLLDAVEYAS
jgi:hypothetical protein